jgi:hypothetical protein
LKTEDELRPDRRQTGILELLVDSIEWRIFPSFCVEATELYEVHQCLLVKM